MDSDTLEFIQILKINDVELWNFADHRSHLLSKSPLEVFYNKEMSVSILKLHNFQYALDRTLKITGSSFDKQLRSYLLPHAGGCYLLKVGTSSTDPAVVNLETLFQNSSQFERNPDLETQLHEYCHKHVLTKGGNLVKDTFLAGTSFVSKGVDAIVHRTQKVNPNQTMIRTIDEIKIVDLDQTSFETFKRKDVIDLLENSNEYSKRQNEGFWNQFGEEKSKISPVERIEEALEPIAQEKTILRKLSDKVSEKGQELVEKAKESISELRTKITGHVEVKEEDKILLREDHFTDIGQMEYLPIDKKTPLTEAVEKASDLVDKAVETVSDLASKITGSGEDGQEIVQKEEVKEKVTPVESESRPVVEQAKETVKGFTRKVSEKLEDYRDSGDLSSDTTIQPNREGPSVLDKVNDEYGKAVDKVAEKAEGVAETFAEVATGSEEKGKDVVESVKEGIQNITRKLSGGADNIQEEEGAGEFKEVKTGFAGITQGHEGQANKQLQSDNPFESLASQGRETESKTATGKAKEGLASASNQIPEKATVTKGKIKSTAVQPDKENAPQSTA